MSVEAGIPKWLNSRPDAALPPDLSLHVSNLPGGLNPFSFLIGTSLSLLYLPMFYVWVTGRKK